jgi:hypothetical protein
MTFVTYHLSDSLWVLTNSVDLRFESITTRRFDSYHSTLPDLSGHCTSEDFNSEKVERQSSRLKIVAVSDLFLIV